MSSADCSCTFSVIVLVARCFCFLFGWRRAPCRQNSPLFGSAHVPVLSEQYEKNREQVGVPSTVTSSKHRVTLDYAMMKVLDERFGNPMVCWASWEPGMLINVDDRDEVFVVSTLAGASPYRGRELYLQETCLCSDIHAAGVRQGHCRSLQQGITTRSCQRRRRVRSHERHRVIPKTVYGQCHCPALFGARDLGAGIARASSSARLLHQHEQLHGRYEYGAGFGLDIQKITNRAPGCSP